ncbi:DJ-1/PfpI family protein [Hwanghaeella sp.]|uniref:DJ-1/PfpI family protein n=1 Tax=Hwanghaeella sp. TaxID=2605943 RepID=UPI003CCBA82F
MTAIAILLFDGVEELDAVGPWEVFSWAAREGEPPVPLSVFTVSRDGAPVTCGKGMVITPDHSFATAPEIDVLLVPGGQGTRPMLKDEEMLDWVRNTAAGCTWVTSVCTGAMVLAQAGLAKGKRITTYHSVVEPMREWSDAEVLSDVRFVRDGNLVTSAGVSAGIDMSLWLVGELAGVDYARAVQQGIEYFPAPPYLYEV